MAEFNSHPPSRAQQEQPGAITHHFCPSVGRDGPFNRTELYRALAYGFGDEFAERVCTAIDAEIHARSESSVITRHQIEWLQRIGECAVHSGRLAK